MLVLGVGMPHSLTPSVGPTVAPGVHPFPQLSRPVPALVESVFWNHALTNPEVDHAKRFPAEYRMRVLALLDAGRSVKDVAADLGISQATIYGWRKQHQIIVPPFMSPSITVT